MAYEPIENYGLIGNMRTVALVSLAGSIDWFCYPQFDSPSVFGALLDDDIGGRFQISPVADTMRRKQFYWPDTNVLITRFLGEDGVAELQDFMPVGAGEVRQGQLFRRVRVVRGCVRFRLVCEPAFDYAREQAAVTVTDDGAAFRSNKLALGMSSTVKLDVTERGVACEFTLKESETVTFVLHPLAAGVTVPERVPGDDATQALFERTVSFWRTWLSACTYTGRWREMVMRSALLLKLLTFEPTGAIVAAPTCGLPELVGGPRNWDYRYAWIRDTAFTVYALLRIGFTSEARAFMTWLEGRCRESDGPLQIAYTIDGAPLPKEEVLDHLRGYRDSRPVRIGNDARNQLQLDIYGEMMDSVYLSNKYAYPVSYDAWTHLRRHVNWVCENWRQPDDGIWEVRGGRQHFVYSKVMCWVALDRGIRLAEKRSFPSDSSRWTQVRDQIYEDIMMHGWSETKGSFRQSYTNDALDAANLIMPLVFFLSPNDPRMLRMLSLLSRPVREGGLVSDGLVYRYDTERTSDGIGGKEGTFNICTFWLVEALTRAARVERAEINDARLLFERMLGYANHVGLYSEETGPCGEALGNFPQAFTHFSLISAAFNLDRSLSPHPKENLL